MKPLTPEEQKALNDREKLGIPTIREDAWKYARADKALREHYAQKTFNILSYVSHHRMTSRNR